MSVDIKTVERIAELANLQFNDNEKVKIMDDMNKMLGFVNKINELDTEGLEPLIYMTDELVSLRPDVVKMDISQEEALKNAPDKDTDFIKVPKVLQGKMK